MQLNSNKPNDTFALHGWMAACVRADMTTYACSVDSMSHWDGCVVGLHEGVRCCWTWTTLGMLDLSS
jgi:hypothetical protein